MASYTTCLSIPVLRKAEHKLGALVVEFGSLSSDYSGEQLSLQAALHHSKINKSKTRTYLGRVSWVAWGIA